MRHHYAGRVHPRNIPIVWKTIAVVAPMSAFGIWALCSMFDEQLIFSSVVKPNMPATTIWESVFVTLLLLSPALGLILIVPAFVPGAFSVTLTDDTVRVRRVLGTRTIPRKEVTFIGLRVQGAWLLAQVGLMVPPSAYYLPDGRPLPAIRLVIEYRNQRRYWPGKLRRVRLPVFFSKEDIDDMQRWASVESLAAA